MATAVVGAVAYILSWPVLWGGLQGIDVLWHWHLESWVATTFPGLPWWYRFDLNGVDYRDGYPLLPHWIAVATARLGGLDLQQGLQLVTFAVTPICALGVYAFFDWRLRRPLAGLAAALLYLLSPLSWTMLVDDSWYASEVGLVFFMPALIALDAFHERWRARESGFTYRAMAVLTASLIALVGIVSPLAFLAPLFAIPAYALASGERWKRWLFIASPLLGAAAIFLQLFWIGPFVDFHAFINSHSPPIVYNPEQAVLVPLQKLFALQPLGAHNDHEERFSLAPVATLAAVLGALYALRERRARPALVLCAGSLLFISARWLYEALSVIPSAQLILPSMYRISADLLRFFVPVLGGLGLFAMPQAIAALLAGRRRMSGVALNVAAGVLGAVLLAAGTVAFAERVVSAPGHVAYGPAFSQTYAGDGIDIRDVWQRQGPDPCPTEAKLRALCGSDALSSTFAVGPLLDACTQGDRVREDVPICAAMHSPSNPRWDAADDALIAQTVTWCSGRSDAICAARYEPLLSQLLDPRARRAPAVGCLLPACITRQDQLNAEAAQFPPPAPERMEVQGEIGDFVRAFHELTGGGTANTIAVGGAQPSLALYSFVEDNLIWHGGSAIKAELAKRLGIDAVGLRGKQQLPQAADYQKLGWRQASYDPVAFVNPAPSGLAQQWSDGNAVLVIGSSQTSSSEVYNTVFERGAQGMLPFDRAWLVRAPTPYVDDYSDQQLGAYRTIVLVGYRYHDRNAAWDRLDRWVQSGGRLYVDTGWQYVDPDWDAGTAPALLPITSLKWTALSAGTPLDVNGHHVSDWGSLSYQGGPWGASVAAGVRPGAEALVTAGGRVLVARWNRGDGRVVWSGMNLFAHATQSSSAAEDAFIVDQASWLLPPAGSHQESLQPQWVGGEKAILDLPASAGPALVLFKQSSFPGWSAQLVTPDGTRPVAIDDAEMDFMLVHLDSIPAGSRLVFSYAPTLADEAWWAASVLALLALVVWVFAPGALAGFGALARRPVGVMRWRWAEEDV